MSKQQLERLNRELAEAREELRTKRDLQQGLVRARESLRRQRRKLWKLEDTLHEHGANIEVLESLSMRGLFLAVLGTRRERLEETRQDLLTAELRYEECKDAIGALEIEVAELEERVERLGEVEEHYQRLLERKKHVLLQTDLPEARGVLDLSEALGDARSDLHELEEAIRAGLLVVSSLDRAISALQSARNWGTVDLLGGGLITTAVKHGRVDEARRWIHEAQQHLRRFRRELADMGPSEGLEIDIGAFATFADYFFDGLIADWVVQRKINSSLERTREMRRSVKAALSALRRRRIEVEQEKRRIHEKKEQLIQRA